MDDIVLQVWGSAVLHRCAQADVDDIFFESSATKSFEYRAAQDVFHERWLGRYQKHFPGNFYVAVSGSDAIRDGADCNGRVVGYLAGCLADPIACGLFDDIAYFKRFAAHLQTYPAHLHINVAHDYRSRGLGARLIARFFEDVRAAGLDGAHVVTGARSRNISFYERCGFLLIDTDGEGARANAFLGARV